MMKSLVTNSRLSLPPAARRRSAPIYAQANPDQCNIRRSILSVAAAGAVMLISPPLPALAADDTKSAPEFVRTASGLLVQDIKEGTGAQPAVGDTVVVQWAGRTKGYQGKVIGNSTRTRSGEKEPFEFKIGAKMAIPAFEEAVLGMKVGGIRRIEVPGEKPELGYPRNRAERYEDFGTSSTPFKYRLGPQPDDLGGERAVAFVLDNNTLQDFNRTMLFDIRLEAVRKGK